MRSAFSAPRTTHIEISYAATGLFVLKSCRSGHIVSPRGRNATHWKLLVNSFCEREGSYKYASRSARTPHIKLLTVARVAPPHRAFVNRAARRRDLSA